MKKLHFFKPVYDNVGIDNLIPEMWAQESLVILEENMVIANRVYRDFSNEIANYGDTVNAHRPAILTAKRKDVNDDVTIQNATVDNVPVVLNQHLHVSILLRDAEMSKSFKDLIQLFLRPAMIGIASGVDKVLLGYVPQFLPNYAGGLDSLAAGNALSYVLGARKIMNDHKAPMAGRDLLITSATETTLLGIEQFISAEKVGDVGTALREASLGRKLGFNIFMGQNTPYVLTGAADVLATVGEINNGAGYPAGTATITVDGYTGDVVPVGSFITIEGSMYPYKVTARTAAPNTTSLTVTPTLRVAVLNDANITVFLPCVVDLPASSYAAGYVKVIHVDGYTVVPQVGQLIQDASQNVYTVMEVSGNTGTECDLLLNRPLVATIADGAILGVGPGGAYNFGFVRDALALVNRPLALPQAPAKAAVASYNNLSMRAVITYDGRAQGHLVTLDMLCGAAVLNPALGVVLLG